MKMIMASLDLNKRKDSPLIEGLIKRRNLKLKKLTLIVMISDNERFKMKAITGESTVINL